MGITQEPDHLLIIASFCPPSSRIWLAFAGEKLHARLLHGNRAEIQRRCTMSRTTRFFESSLLV